MGFERNHLKTWLCYVWLSSYQLLLLSQRLTDYPFANIYREIFNKTLQRVLIKLRTVNKKTNTSQKKQTTQQQKSVVNCSSLACRLLRTGFDFFPFARKASCPNEARSLELNTYLWNARKKWWQIEHGQRNQRNTLLRKTTIMFWWLIKQTITETNIANVKKQPTSWFMTALLQ